jgi:hypothetical protein
MANGQHTATSVISLVLVFFAHKMAVCPQQKKQWFFATI